MFAMMGDCVGGALELDDGRRFYRKYHWYRYNGAHVAHGVAPFTGERLTCVLYQDNPKTAFYVCAGSEPKPVNQEAVEQTGEHPGIVVNEDPEVVKQREKQLEIARGKKGEA